jgi:hypothetical protein
LDEFIELTNGIQRALFAFDSTSNHAVLRLYNRVDAQGPTSHASIASASTDDNSDPFLSVSDNEHVFLVYLYVGHVTLFFPMGLSFTDSYPVLVSYSLCRSLRGSSYR